MTNALLSMAAVAAGFLIDCLIGDPSSIPHPVCFIGSCISKGEKLFRRLCSKTPKGEKTAGVLMVCTTLIISGAVPFAVLYGASLLGKWVYFIVCTIMSWQIFAAKCLKDEAMKVQRALESGDIEKSRHQVAMLVGRDTQSLSDVQVAKAAIETVAENTSDGVIAPMFYMIIGGPVLGFLYKAINTMDSMVAYKNDKYINFGFCAAKLDDAANYIPARLSGIGMVLAAGLCGFDTKNAWRIYKRDKRKHASPNSAQTEAACAGALHIQLAGDASYFGVLHKKPFLGDKDRDVEYSDIKRSCSLMYMTTVLWLVVMAACKAAILCFI